MNVPQTGAVVVGDWVKVTERARKEEAWDPTVTEVWKGRVTDIKTAWIGCEDAVDGPCVSDATHEVTPACEETEFLVCFTDENSGEMMEWYEWQVEIIRPPVSKGWFLQVDELIESLKHLS